MAALEVTTVGQFKMNIARKTPALKFSVQITLFTISHYGIENSRFLAGRRPCGAGPIPGGRSLFDIEGFARAHSPCARACSPKHSTGTKTTAEKHRLFRI